MGCVLWARTHEAHRRKSSFRTAPFEKTVPAPPHAYGGSQLSCPWEYDAFRYSLEMARACLSAGT